jgi:hypothetical protein
MAEGGKYKPLEVMLPGFPLSPPEADHFTIAGAPLFEVAVNCTGVLVEVVIELGEMLKDPFEDPPGANALELPQPARTTRNAMESAARRLVWRIATFTPGGGTGCCRRAKTLAKKPADRTSW